MADNNATNSETMPSLQLHRLFRGVHPHKVEAGLVIGKEALYELRGIFSTHLNESSLIQNWNQQINNALDQSNLDRTIVGFFGSTGAGKTSVLNAILDKGDLLPTSSMQACTSTVTEISYSGPNAPFSAEIEFMTIDEWKDELELASRVLFDDEGNLEPDARNRNTDVGILFTKLKTVYQGINIEDLAPNDIKQLLAHRAVQRLGTIQRIKEDAAKDFALRLKVAIGGKVRAASYTRSKISASSSPTDWPLIRKIKISGDFPTLSTGITLVDLPGIQDNNPAREKITTDYVKHCSHLMIVTPIHRAIDDKVARTLLSESLKQQLRFDGALHGLMFVCTKTDDPPGPSESFSPDLDCEISDLEEDLSTCHDHKEVLQEEAKTLEVALKTADTHLDDTVRQFRSQRNRSCLPNILETRELKRVRPSSTAESSNDHYNEWCKRRKALNPGTTRHEATDNRSQSNKTCSPDEQYDAALAQKEAAKRALEQNMKAIQACDKRIETLLGSIKSKRIEGRNKIVQGVLRDDFAAGIADMERSMRRETQVTSGSDFEAQDCKTLAEDVLVSCVSAKAYLCMTGHQGVDRSFSGFQNTEETGIPELQEHLRKLANHSRQKSALHFLALLSRLLSSISRYVRGGTGQSLVVSTQPVGLKDLLQEEVESLKMSNMGNITKHLNNMDEAMVKQIYEKFQFAVAHANQESTGTVEKWNRLHWKTYKAICARDGKFKNGNGDHDWNSDLLKPLLECIIPSWEYVFSEGKDRALGSLTVSLYNSVKCFHDSFRTSLVASGIQEPRGYRMLSMLVPQYRHSFEKVKNDVKRFIDKEQRKINRAFKPVIQETMRPAYRACSAELGQGCARRMQIKIEDHVSENLDMFDESIETVQQRLVDLTTKAKQKICDGVEKIHRDMVSLYWEHLIGHNDKESKKNIDQLKGPLSAFLAKTVPRIHPDSQDIAIQVSKCNIKVESVVTLKREDD